MSQLFILISYQHQEPSFTTRKHKSNVNVKVDFNSVFSKVFTLIHSSLPWRMPCQWESWYLTSAWALLYFGHGCRTYLREWSWKDTGGLDQDTQDPYWIFWLLKPYLITILPWLAKKVLIKHPWIEVFNLVQYFNGLIGHFNPGLEV